ncbi:hypothetical protein JOL62DRAFT_616714 [Phyllosticta paracitricarpa]|uniref:F-box domain-containing protein n=2 Tax=Phyllosticta TaxID=121621 RepID=A0ABR1MSF1_9PEZI
MPELLDLSNEILHSIFSHAQADDLAHLSETCRSLHQFINGDDLLWKEVHLEVFDDPRQQFLTISSWHDELSRMWKLHKILSSEDEQVKTRNMQFVATSIFQLLEKSSPEPESKTRSWLRRHFENHLNYHSLLCKSPLYREAFAYRNTRRSSTSTKIDQLSAKLHVLHGVYCECSEHVGPEHDASPPLDAYARSRMYDLRLWHSGNSWGPLMDDSSERVDWVKMSYIMIDLLSEQRKFCKSLGSSYLPLWHLPFAGAAPNTYMELDHRHAPSRPPSAHESSYPDTPIVKEPELSLDQQDPYGVTGTWFRIILFIDYSDLYNFNLSLGPLPSSLSRPPLEKKEATRFLVVRLQVTKIEPVVRDGEKQLPAVHFEGDSRVHEDFDAIPGFYSMTKGHVRQNPEGEIRWTTMSNFNGEERWKTECIQVGGLRSERGVLGTWFDKDNANIGPIGPTCWWKVSDRQLGKDLPSTMRRSKPGCRGWRRYG